MYANSPKKILVNQYMLPGGTGLMGPEAIKQFP